MTTCPYCHRELDAPAPGHQGCCSTQWQRFVAGYPPAVRLEEPPPYDYLSRALEALDGMAAITEGQAHLVGGELAGAMRLKATRNRLYAEAIRNWLRKASGETQP